MRIVDIHCHLGDILHLGGGAVAAGGMLMARPFDPDALRRLFLYRLPLLDRLFYQSKPIEYLMARAERERNLTATRISLSRRMDRFGVAYAAVLPVAPNLTFTDAAKAAEGDRRIIPFGSFDFTAPDLAGQARRQLERGAKGFKLHPILQRVDPAGPEVHEALASLPEGAAVVLHTGVSHYYAPREAHLQRPEYGAIKGIARLCADFPDLVFIAAHGGLRQSGEFLALLPRLPNVHADTTFLSPEGIRALIHAFGADRVLFGSDWPYGFHSTAIKCVQAACKNDFGELEAILGGNAERILKL